MATTAALNTSDITKVGIIVIVALVVIGALLSLVITAIVGRIVILVVVVVAGALVWQQRTHIKSEIDKCHLSATFFGIHLQAPDSVRRACLNRPKG